MPNPILKVLSTLNHHEVKYLLMGGQACVYYGAAEFSRDTDVAILSRPDNIERLKNALHALQAKVIAVPSMDIACLDKGHAIHFRCQHPDANGMRLDIMSVMRNLPGFDELWPRRTTAEIEGHSIDLLSLPDLITAKKTQRDKDWPMIRRLVEAHYVSYSGASNAEREVFWLRECRTPSLLRVLVTTYPGSISQVEEVRPFLKSVDGMTDEYIEKALYEEETRERALDRAYWKPLREELERMRHGG